MAEPVQASPGAIMPPFVGRRIEIKRLTDRLDAAAAGKGSITLITGEPGIGKSRCLEELRGAAGERNIQIIFCHCLEDQVAPAFGPWIEAIRALLRSPGSAEVVRDGPVHLQVIRAVVPEATAGLVPEPKASPVGAATAFYRFADEVCFLLRAAAGKHTLLLIIEDLQWADEPSLQLLEYVAYELADMACCVVGSARSEEARRRHAVSRALTVLSRHPTYMRIDLEGLGQSDALALARTRVTVGLSEKVLQRVHESTGGNPLFVIEMAGLIERGVDINLAEVPRDIRSVIDRRLAPYAPQTRKLLELAALMGDRFDAERLRAVVGAALSRVVESTLSDCVRDRVVVEAGDAPGRYRFVHDLFRRAVIDAVPPHARSEMHGRIALSLETWFGERAVEHATELAYHFVRATPQDLGRIARYARTAGELAWSRYDYEASLELFERSMAAVTALDGRVGDRYVELLYLLTRTRLTIFPAEGIGDLIRVFDHYMAKGDAGRAAEVAATRVNYGFGGQARGATTMIEGVLERVAPGSQIHAALLCQYQRALFQERGDVEGARQVRRRAVAAAESLGDSRLLLHARYPTLYWVSSLTGDVSIEAQREDLERSRRLGDRVLEQKVCANLLWRLALGGMFELAAAYLPTARELVLRIPAYTGANITIVASWIATEVGDYGTTDAFVEGLRYGERFVMARYIQLARELVCGTAQAPPKDLEAFLAVEPYGSARYNVAPASPGAMSAWYAHYVCQGGVPELLEHAHRAATGFRNRQRYVHHAAFADVALALIAVARRDREAARVGYQRIGALDGRFGTSVSLDRLLGLLARVIGDIASARRHLESGLEFLGGSGSRLELGWCFLDLAELLTDHYDPDLARIEALLDRSEGIARDLALPLLKRRIEGLRARLGPAGFGLSRREREVLLLLSKGQTNKEIAAALFITERTVAKHVGAILAKTGAGNRTEAAALVLTGGGFAEVGGVSPLNRRGRFYRGRSP